MVNDDKMNTTLCKTYVYDKQEMRQLHEYSYANSTLHSTGSIEVPVLLLPEPTVAPTTYRQHTFLANGGLLQQGRALIRRTSQRVLFPFTDAATKRDMTWGMHDTNANIAQLTIC